MFAAASVPSIVGGREPATESCPQLLCTNRRGPSSSVQEMAQLQYEVEIVTKRAEMEKENQLTELSRLSNLVVSFQQSIMQARNLQFSLLQVMFNRSVVCGSLICGSRIDAEPAIPASVHDWGLTPSCSVT